MLRLDALAAALGRRQRFTQSRPRRAAILLPLLGSGADLSLVLTRRSEAMSSHPGQVAFPGGVCDASDANLEATALREAHEEIGLASHDATVLGLLDDLPSIKNDMAVSPVVARLSSHLTCSDFVANPSEVARIFTIPLRELQRRERWSSETTEWRGQPFENFSFAHDGEKLYGLSAFATLMLIAIGEPASSAPVPSWFQPAGRRSPADSSGALGSESPPPT